MEQLTATAGAVGSTFVNMGMQVLDGARAGVRGPSAQAEAWRADVVAHQIGNAELRAEIEQLRQRATRAEEKSFVVAPRLRVLGQHRRPPLGHGRRLEVGPQARDRAVVAGRPPRGAAGRLGLELSPSYYDSPPSPLREPTPVKRVNKKKTVT